MNYNDSLKVCGQCKEFPRWLEAENTVRLACPECGRASKKFKWEEAGRKEHYMLFNSRANVINYWNDRQNATQNLCQHIWRRKYD